MHFFFSLHVETSSVEEIKRNGIVFCITHLQSSPLVPAQTQRKLPIAVETRSRTSSLTTSLGIDDVNWTFSHKGSPFIRFCERKAHVIFKKRANTPQKFTKIEALFICWYLAQKRSEGDSLIRCTISPIWNKKIHNFTVHLVNSRECNLKDSFWYCPFN